jgi:hypothetical protein
MIQEGGVLDVNSTGRRHPVDIRWGGRALQPTPDYIQKNQAHFCSSYLLIFSTRVVRLTCSSLAALFLTHLVFSSD